MQEQIKSALSDGNRLRKVSIESGPASSAPVTYECQQNWEEDPCRTKEGLRDAYCPRILVSRSCLGKSLVCDAFSTTSPAAGLSFTSHISLALSRLVQPSRALMPALRSTTSPFRCHWTSSANITIRIFLRFRNFANICQTRIQKSSGLLMGQ